MKKVVCILVFLASFISFVVCCHSKATNTNSLVKESSKEISKYFALNARLYRVLSMHPVIEIRQNFLPKIMTGEVFVVYESEEGRGTFFSATLTDGVQIHVAEELLMRPLRLQQLVLFHEFVHYQQYIGGHAFPEMFNPSFADAYPEKRESFCKQKWHTEFEAYQKECELSDRLKGGPDFCRGFQASDFVEKLAAWVAVNDSSASICKETYLQMVQSKQF